MTAGFIPLDKVEWQRIKYLKTPLSGTDEQANWECEFWLARPLADWDVFSYWEAPRFFSMKKHLKTGDVLFDVGTEQGWMNLAYASLVGPENMVLIEPTKEFWPNIRALWEKNYDVEPLGYWCGFFGDEDDEEWLREYAYWPEVSRGDLIDRNKYQNLYDRNVKETTVDVYVSLTGFEPTALTIDTEGSELLILKGAEKTLKRLKPKLWVSVHSDMALRDYGVKENELNDYLKGLGYKGEWLATDHEEHWYYA